ncbi:transporter (plasmid) [Polymorphobacter megasporae]|nr:transporter [Polymorphobacter sp. PAMC 29334]UAJ12908.1 transporter [Polymorphobacter megasporae]
MPDAAPKPLDNVDKQWFTGSLEASSPALSKAGAFALEPYFILETHTGAYNGAGHHSAVAHDSSLVESVVVMKYGITNRLTIEALPTFLRGWTDQALSHGSGVADLPIELEYRILDENNRTGAPSVTFSVGITAPIGDYQNLRDPIDGIGSGAFTLKQGLVVQSLFSTWGNHPVRLRLFGSVNEPLADVGLRGQTAYGTGPGFFGRVKPGITTQVGFAGGWALNQRWVFAADVVEDYADGARLLGTDGGGGFVSTSRMRRYTTSIAPAVEYNWSANVGLIVGVDFTLAGRNSASYVAPQVAFAFSF